MFSLSEKRLIFAISFSLKLIFELKQDVLWIKDVQVKGTKNNIIESKFINFFFRIKSSKNFRKILNSP